MPPPESVHSSLAVSLNIAGLQLPVVAAYRLWTKGPFDVLSTEFATGTDQGPTNHAAYPLLLPTPVPGGVLLYYIALQGDAGQPYQVVLTIGPAGQPGAAGPTTLAGQLDANGRAYLQGQLALTQ